MQKKIALIVGAGPAGLTAAYELLTRTDVHPIVLEKTTHLGGLSKTINYKGNRMDIGGHRFFSKSDRVVDWWINVLPIQKINHEESTFDITYQNKNRSISVDENGPNPEEEDRVMLIRKRKSRIYFLRKFFDYPLSLTLSTLHKLGLIKTIRISFSYLFAKFFPIRPEKTLKDFIINRFGKELYHSFFESYSEKVWGVPCSDIKAEWGYQRIKGLSLRKALLSRISTLLSKDASPLQKNVETSLIERFMYPKYGPGQMWEEVAEKIKSLGGEIHLESTIQSIKVFGNSFTEVEIKDLKTNEVKNQSIDYFFSTIPVKELVSLIGNEVPSNVKIISDALQYRDFITVGILVNKMLVSENNKSHTSDNWIYIQENDVFMGRLQIYNNWSPYMVSDNNKTWMGAEFFCNEGDSFWNKTDDELKQVTIDELIKMKLIDRSDVVDSNVVRNEKAYPGYFGAYEQFSVVKSYLDKYENLFLIGRNGMHRYNNQDHSMLSAMVAVDNIKNEVTSKENIWSVNTEQEYHEEK